MDRFSDPDSSQRFRSEHDEDYAELDSRCAQLTTSTGVVVGMDPHKRSVTVE